MDNNKWRYRKKTLMKFGFPKLVPETDVPSDALVNNFRDSIATCHDH